MNAHGFWWEQCVLLYVSLTHTHTHTHTHTAKQYTCLELIWKHCGGGWRAVGCRTHAHRCWASSPALQPPWQSQKWRWWVSRMPEQSTWPPPLQKRRWETSTERLSVNHNFPLICREPAAQRGLLYEVFIEGALLMLLSNYRDYTLLFPY